MNITKYFLLASVGLMVVSCQDKKETVPGVIPNSGDEVQFGGNLKAAAISRTIYDYDNESSTDVPILWLKDDKMIVTSPDASTGRETGIYGVSTEGFPTPAVDKWDTAEYGGTLQRQGDVGVQWGEKQQETFYSMYPYRDANPITTENFTTFSCKLPDTQTCLVEKINNSGVRIKTADMYACFMYAKTTADRIEDDGVVNLDYIPISTALRFTLKAAENGSVTVQNIRLVAPVAIAGEFSVDLTNIGEDNMPKVDLGANTSNSITVFARYENQDYLQLSNEQSITLNAFIIPQKDLTITKDWYLLINLSDGRTFKKTLESTKATQDQGANKLIAGQIHTLPTLPAFTSATFNPENWMKNIPRNVYLSEISIPGSWSSLNSKYQNNQNSIDTQYGLGCRAFHLDTRYRSRKPTFGDRYATDLSIANGTTSRDIDGKEVMQEGDSYVPYNFGHYLEEITDNLDDEEFMILLCTFALDSYQPTDITDLHRDKWYKDVSYYCSLNDKVLNVKDFTSTYYETKHLELNRHTTVGDVLGKVIVICGVESMTDIPSDSKCLFVDMPLARRSTDFVFTSNPKYTKSDIYPLPVKDPTEPGKINTDKITLYNTLAQITYDAAWLDNITDNPDFSGKQCGGSISNRGYAPTAYQRKTVVNNILNWKVDNYEVSNSYLHNAWIFLGLGGYKSTETSSEPVPQYSALTNYLNKYFDQNLTAMENSKYYPVGIVLFNRLDYTSRDITYPSTAEVIKVLELNGKFHKAFDASKVAFK